LLLEGRQPVHILRVIDPPMSMNAFFYFDETLARGRYADN
jgi:hypothetical protein